MKLLFIISFILLMPGISYADDAAMIAIENTYRNAIVKVDVSSNTRIDKNGSNICKSEGTGFLVNRSRIVTAAHVIELDPSCGEKIIIIKSRKHNIQKLGKVIISEEDVAVIETKPFENDTMCSLFVSPINRYETRGYRYGIPDGLEDPDPESLTIGEEDNQFKPLVRLRPVATHRGDSGGPVLDIFKVIGITKARHETYNDLSLMITSRVIYNILLKSNTIVSDKGDSFECNPAKYEVKYVISPVNDPNNTRTRPPLHDQQFPYNFNRPVFPNSPSDRPTIFGRQTQISVKVAPEIIASGRNNELVLFNDIVRNSVNLLGNVSNELSKQIVVNPSSKGFDVNEVGAPNQFPPLGSIIIAIDEASKNRWWKEYISALDKKRLEQCARGVNICNDIIPPR